MKKLAFLLVFLFCLALSGCSQTKTHFPPIKTYAVTSTAKANTADIEEAQDAAADYCVMLKSKQRSIISITYTGDHYKSGSTYYFEYRVQYTSTTRYGNVKVVQDSYGSYKAVGLEF